MQLLNSNLHGPRVVCTTHLQVPVGSPRSKSLKYLQRCSTQPYRTVLSDGDIDMLVNNKQETTTQNSDHYKGGQIEECGAL